MRRSKTNTGRRRVAISIRTFLVLLIVIFPLNPLTLLLGLQGGIGHAYGQQARDDQASGAPDDQSDLNKDGVINLKDLKIFSSRWLKTDWEEIDWRSWITGNSKTKRHLGPGLSYFIKMWFAGDKDPLKGNFPVENNNEYPTRLAWGPKGKLFVTDCKVGSVFIYKHVSNKLKVVGELKGFETPLGVAVDKHGNIYVGNDGVDNVEVYTALGWKKATIGQGIIKMPTDLAVADDGRLYVADSVNNTVWVYDGRFGTLKNFGSSGNGNGNFNFPTAVTVAAGELFVADQGNALIQVFDLDGKYQRSYGGFVEQGMMGWKWKGKFVKLQSLLLDKHGRVHAGDSYMAKGQILDPATGVYIDSYGSFGTNPGELNLPLDMAIDGSGRVAVANAENKRVEIIYTVY